MESQKEENALAPDEINGHSDQFNPKGGDEVIKDQFNAEESEVSNIWGSIPKIGMKFQSIDQAYDFYNAYARSTGFSIRKSNCTRDREKKIKRRVFCCSKEGIYNKHTRGTPKKQRAQMRTGCKAYIVVQLDDEESKYVVVEFNAEHNHELINPSKSYMLRSQRKIETAQAGLIENMRSAGFGSGEIFSYLSTEAGGAQYVGFTQVDCNNFYQGGRRNILKKGDAKLLFNYFTQVQTKNPSFFYSIQVDDDNRMCSCFWSDAKSRVDYSYFGDVVCFDTTYNTNGYDKPFAPIIGVNNHMQTILFGGALMFDETIESFVWVFETFLKAMNGKYPKAIFTDQAPQIANAIRQVFPNTHHRLCLWHISQNAIKHLSAVLRTFPDFGDDFKSCIHYPEIEEDFLLSWDALLKKYNLEDNKWLQSLFDLREKWAQVYGREHFCANMTTTQRSEGMNSYFKKYFRRTMTLTEFVSQYEKAVTSRRGKETYEDVQTRQTKPNLVSKWTVELHASKKYTRKVFNIFQKEYLSCLDLRQEVEVESETKKIYKVSPYVDGRSRTVTFDSSDNTIYCSCKKFEFMGILCGHILKILHELHLPDIPSQYYLNRWTRDATADAICENFGRPMQVESHSSLTVLYSELAHMALTLAVKGATNKRVGEMAKTELSRLLDKVHEQLKIRTDHDESLEDPDVNLDPENVVGHSNSNITILDPPRKKTKGGRIKSSIEKKKNSNNSQLKPQRGTTGTRRKLMTETPSPTIHDMPMPHFSESIQKENQTINAQSTSMSGLLAEQNATTHWFSSPIPPNIGLHTRDSTLMHDFSFDPSGGLIMPMQGLHSFNPGGGLTMPMQGLHSFNYTQSFDDKGNEQTNPYFNNNGTTSSNQGFFDPFNQQSSNLMQQSSMRRLDFSKPSDS